MENKSLKQKKKVKNDEKHELNKLLSKIKIKRDFVDSSNTTDYLLNYAYDNKYFKPYFLKSVFYICFFTIVLTGSNILMFFSVIRDPALVYNYKAYDDNASTYGKVSKKSLCLCYDTNHCVNSCYKTKEECTEFFQIQKGNLSVKELKSNFGVNQNIWFESDNKVKTIFYGSLQYCSLKSALLIIACIFFVGAMLGDIILSILSDRYGLVKVNFISLCSLTVLNIVVTSFNRLSESERHKENFFSKTTGLYAVYGLFSGVLCFHTLYGTYSYVLQIYPSNFGYFLLNSQVSSYTAFSFIIAIVFSIPKDFKYYFLFVSIGYAILSFLTYFYCPELARHYSEYLMRKQKEGFFHKHTTKLLMILKTLKDSQIWLTVSEKEVDRQTLYNEEFQYKELVLYNPHNEVIIGEEVISKIDYNKELRRIQKIKTNEENQNERENKETIKHTNSNSKGKKTKKTLATRKAGSLSSNYTSSTNNLIRMNKPSKRNLYTLNQSKTSNKSKKRKRRTSEEKFKEPPQKCMSKIDLRPKYKKNKIHNMQYEINIDEDDGKDFQVNKRVKKELNVSFLEIYSRITNENSHWNSILLYIIIWLIFSYIHTGLQIRFFYDVLDPNTKILDDQVGLVVYYIIMQIVLPYITGKIAIYVSIKRIILLYLFIATICAIFPDRDNIWLESDRRKFFSSVESLLLLPNSNYLKATALIFSCTSLSFINLMTLSMPHTSYRGTFCGLCRAVSHFSNLISFYSVIVNTTQYLIIMFLGVLSILIFLTLNLGLSSEIEFKEIIDSTSYKTLKEKKYRNI